MMWRDLGIDPHRPARAFPCIAAHRRHRRVRIALALGGLDHAIDRSDAVIAFERGGIGDGRWRHRLERIDKGLVGRRFMRAGIEHAGFQSERGVADRGQVLFVGLRGAEQPDAGALEVVVLVGLDHADRTAGRRERK